MEAPLVAHWSALLLSACQPAPGEVQEALAEGHLDAASELLGRLPEGGDLEPLRALSKRRARVLSERRALQAVEKGMLTEAASQALAHGELEEAAGPLTAAIATWPEDPALQREVRQLEVAARGADSTRAAPAWAVLAEIRAGEPEARRLALRESARAALIARYRPEAFEETRAAQVGIGLEAALDLLARIDREYLVEPDWKAVASAGRAALAWLGEAPGALAAWPGLASTGWAMPADHQAATAEGLPLDLPGAAASLNHALSVARRAGVPEEVVIAEWVDAGLAALDPWTRAVWPAEIASWEAHNAGVTTGVGLELTNDADLHVVVRWPQPGAPAWESGIHQGDRLERVEDAQGVTVIAELPEGRRLTLARAALEGPNATALGLDLSRQGRPLHFDLVRAPVALETVEGWSRMPDSEWDPWLDEAAGLAYIRISTFRPPSESAFDALVDPIADRLRGLVLDLRANPGGDVDAAVQIADRFIDSGWICGLSGRVLPETGPDIDPVTGAPLAAWNQAVSGHALEGLPVAVLVDADTASAAEVLAGALQERAGAVVVGAPTWGKGYAQALRLDAEGRYGVQLTNLVWTLPSGRQLAHDLGGGIQPDQVDPLTPAERFLASVERRRRGALVQHADGTPSQAEDPGTRDDLPPLSEDPQLLDAELVLRGIMAERAE